ncbi:MAG: Tim44/TimA family putative adaptor protein [Alphaproteobacteria bacterium]|nr:Tim44/TimA family putative adaptor protein [Alphaproteobacteria bacterium]
MGSLDIIILLVAVVLIFQKLRSLLGTRPDEEVTRIRISDENAARIFDMIAKEAEKQQLTARTAAEGFSGTAEEETEELSDTDKTLANIPGFNKERFLTGAKRAFEIIICAFSQGDTETLENLASPQLIKKFQEIIEDRRAQGITAETDLIGFEQAEIVNADIDEENNAKITVKFISEQVNLLRNKDNEVIQGDENFIQNITDIWTFERCLTSVNPNWLLVSTKKQ